MSQKIIFLDRDGTINEKPPSRSYLKQPTEVKYLPGVKEALQRLSAQGFSFVVATCQMGISLGAVSKTEVDSVNKFIENDLTKEGVKFLNWYVCPHVDADNCVCRKPKPGLMRKALQDFGVKPEQCWNVGDSPRDILMGLNAGCLKNILVKSGYRAREEELAEIVDTPVVDNLNSAANLILYSNLG